MVASKCNFDIILLDIESNLSYQDWCIQTVYYHSFKFDKSETAP